MSTPGRVSVKTIISNVIRDLRLADVSSVYDSFIEWAYEAEVLIGSYDTFVRKECEITIKNGRARLPSDFYQFIAFKIGNSYPEVTNRDFRLFYHDSPNVATLEPTISTSLDLTKLGSTIGVDGTEIRTMKMTLERHWIHVSGIKEETKGGLAYLAIDVDDDGLPYVKDGHEMAVVAYISWKYKTADYINGKVPAHVYQSLENRWYWLCGQARGNDEMPDPKQLEYIASIYSQLLPMANKNFF